MCLEKKSELYGERMGERMCDTRGIYSQTTIKFIYPNPAETMGGGKITLLSTRLSVCVRTN